MASSDTDYSDYSDDDIRVVKRKAVDILDQPPPDGARAHWINFASAELKSKDQGFPLYPMYEKIYNNFDTGKDAKGITITYRTYYRDTMEPKVLKRTLEHALKLIIKDFDNDAKARFKAILLSEYDTNCNFHWHGYISGLRRSEYAKLHARLTQMIGFNKIEHNIKSWSQWTNYIMKEFEEDTKIIITKNI